MLKKLTQDHWIMLFLLLVVFASAADLIADLSEGVTVFHLVQEGIVLVVATLAFAWLAWTLAQRNREVSALHRELESVKNMPPPTTPGVVEARQKMAEVIAEQFKAWSLTPSEKEIGLLLLKGFSLKEISALRGTSEKTIRQQASSIYQKADVAGRHAFSAWFFEDFL